MGKNKSNLSRGEFMKKLIILFLLSFVLYAQEDINVLQDSVLVDISSDSNTVTVDLYAEFGQGKVFTPKFIGFTTDTTMTSTTVTFKVYDSISATYKTMEDEDGASVTFAITANRFYTVNPHDFAGINKFQLEFGSAETADRVIGIYARDY